MISEQDLESSTSPQSMSDSPPTVKDAGIKDQISDLAIFVEVYFLDIRRRFLSYVICTVAKARRIAAKITKPMNFINAREIGP